MTHGNYKIISDEDMQLGELDLLPHVVVARRPQHHEEGFPVPLQLRSLVRLHGILDRELMQVELARDRGNLPLVRADQADPCEVLLVFVMALTQQLVGLTERVRLRETPALGVERVLHHGHHASSSRGLRAAPVGSMVPEHSLIQRAYRSNP